MELCLTCTKGRDMCCHVTGVQKRQFVESQIVAQPQGLVICHAMVTSGNDNELLRCAFHYRFTAPDDNA